MEQKLKGVALDIDGVLATVEPALKQMVAERFSQVDLTKLEHSGAYNNMFQFEDKDLEKDVGEFVSQCFGESEVYLRADVVEGSLAAAWALHEAGQLKAYITRRPESVKLATQMWLNSARFPDAPLEHTPRSMCKSTFMTQYDCNLIVEDSPVEVKRLFDSLGEQVKIIVPAYNYNESVTELGKNVIRVADWQEALTYIR